MISRVVYGSASGESKFIWMWTRRIGWINCSRLCNNENEIRNSSRSTDWLSVQLKGFNYIIGRYFVAKCNHADERWGQLDSRSCWLIVCVSNLIRVKLWECQPNTICERLSINLNRVAPRMLDAQLRWDSKWNWNGNQLLITNCMDSTL